MGWEIERVPVKQPTTDEAIKELSIKLASAEALLDGREKMILNLQNELKVAGEVCTSLSDGNARLREEKETLQEQCSQLLDKQVQDDYKVENAKKIVENLKKTVERYEKENKAMRELLALWI